VVLNQGIEFYFESLGSGMSKRVLFGQTLTNVLDVLGNPNKEYHKGEQIFLNYFELGLDVMISA